MSVLDKKIIELQQKATFAGNEVGNSWFPFTLAGVDYKTNILNLSTVLGTVTNHKFISNNVEIIVEGDPRVARLNNLDGGNISYTVNGTDYSVVDDVTCNIPDATKNYTLILTTSNTFEAIESDNILNVNNLNYITIGFVVNTSASLWYDNGNWVRLLTPRNIMLEKTINFDEGINFASANEVTLADGGNCYEMADNSNQLQLLNTQNSSGVAIFKNGTFIILKIPVGGTIKHLATANGTLRPFNLRLENDFTATRIEYIPFVHENNTWNEVGATTVLGVIELSSYTAIKSNAFCDVVGIGDIFIGFGAGYFTGKILTYNGTAIIDFDVTDAKIESTQAGTLYNVKVFDSDGITLLHWWPLTEAPFVISSGNADLTRTDRYDVVNDAVYDIDNVTDYDVQNDLFYAHDTGFGIIEYSTLLNQIITPNPSLNTLSDFYLIQSNLVASFFNGSGQDDSGNGITVNVSGATLTTDKNSVANQAYLFDGADDYIDYSDFARSGSLDFSVSLWMNPDANGDNAVSRVVTPLDGSTEVNLGILYLRASQEITIYEYDSGESFSTGTDTVVQGSWSHIVVTYQHSTKNIKLYVDKSLLIDEIFVGSGVTESFTHLYLGNIPALSRSYGGKLDQFRYHDNVLTTDAINYLYNNYDYELSGKGTIIMQNGSGNGNFLGAAYECILLPQPDSEIDSATTGAYKIDANTSYTYDEIVAMAAASPASGNLGHIEITYNGADPNTHNIEKIEVEVSSDGKIKTLYTFNN